jgi:AcrR family transcriptional regulator
VEAIAAEADVAVASIYFHFRGKGDVYLALVDRVLEANERYMAEAYGAPGLASVLAASDAYVRFHLDHPLAMRLVALRDLELTEADDRRAARARIAARLDAMARELADHIAAAVKAGEVRGDIAPGAAATFVWGAWNGVLALRARGTVSDRHMREALAAGREIVVAGLAPAGS